MDLLIWRLYFGELAEGDAFTPMIHSAAEHSRKEGVIVRQMRKRDLENEVRRFMDVYNEAWGKQLGLRPDHRGRGQVPGQEPEAGARRALGDDRRARRQGRRRRADSARRQPGPEEDEREAVPGRLVALPAPQEVHRPPSRLRARRQVRLPAPRRRGRPVRTPPRDGRRTPGPAAATWAGSWSRTRR